MRQSHSDGGYPLHEHEASGERTDAGRLEGLANLSSERTPKAIRRTMALARETLEMDVAFVSRFAEDRMEFRALEGDAESFGWR